MDRPENLNREYYVKWGGGKVIDLTNSSERYLYTTGVSSCVIVLARGYEEGNKTPRFLALDHIFMYPS